jgi:hypothetical protein
MMNCDSSVGKTLGWTLQFLFDLQLAQEFLVVITEFKSRNIAMQREI